jgi:hypothetical protein
MSNIRLRQGYGGQAEVKGIKYQEDVRRAHLLPDTCCLIPFRPPTTHYSLASAIRFFP